MGKVLATAQAAKIAAASHVSWEWGSVPDWIAAISAVLTFLLAAYVGIVTFRQQRATTDIQVALTIFDSINRYWDSIIERKGSDEEYYTGQILAQFELASSLFNHNVLSRTALPILKDHIIEVFGAIESSAQGRALIEQCKSSPDTFSELKTFLSRHIPRTAYVLDQQ